MAAEDSSPIGRAEVDARLDAMSTWLDALEDATDELRVTVADLEDRVEALEADTATRDAAPTDPGTKVDLARQVARDEAVRRSTRGIRGGAVDFPTVRDLADRDVGVVLNSGTVYDAFDRLADEWAAFHVEDGEDGPHTQNTQLRCERDAITPALEDVVRTSRN